MPGRSHTQPAPTLVALRRDVHALRDPERASFLQRFFRTGPGEYAEGDRMLGLTVPVSRKVAHAYRDLPIFALHDLLASEWHEHRLIALLILVKRHTHSNHAIQFDLHRFYLDHIDRVNNWDLVDISAAVLVGTHTNAAGEPALSMAQSPHLWTRRASIVSTFAQLRTGQTALTFTIAEGLLGDRHDLIHKAVGWLLREAGKREEPALLAFLRRHYTRLPRTTLRYSIERLTPGERKAWLAGPQ